MPFSIYLARHATPDRFRSGFVYHQLPGPPLTLQGIQEAQFLGAYFKSARVCRIYASPFERCRHTAEIAAGIAEIPWEINDPLGELQPGETLEGILERAQPAFERICAQSQETGPAAVVTHGGVVSALLQHLGMQQTELDQHKTFDYGNPLPPAGAWLAVQNGSDKSWNLNLAFKPDPLPAEI